MKVIDLLNKIANGEEVPNKIKTKNDIWIYDDKDCEGIDYRASDDRGYMFEVHTRINKDDLNEEVEIIEEDKKIEKLENLNVNYCRDEMFYETLTKEQIALDISTLQKWVNKIIDKLNEVEKC